MNVLINDLHNIINTNLKCKKILYNIKIDSKLSPGFADFIPNLLDSEENLNLWYDNIIKKSLKKINIRKSIIKNKLNKELEELKKLKQDSIINSYYLNLFNLAKPFLDKNCLKINNLTQEIIKKKTDQINKNKLILLDQLKNKNIEKENFFHHLKPILRQLDQLKACKKIITKDFIIDDSLEDKIKNKKFQILKKINKLRIYNGSKIGIGFERLGFKILKQFAKKLGSEYLVGEVLSNNVWKLNEKKKKGMKQDIDGFIFKLNNGIIEVHEIYEFKSCHLAIVEDITKLEKLLDYLLIINYNIEFKKCNDNIYRPTKIKNDENLILNSSSFSDEKFKKNRYQNIKYLFKIEKDFNVIQFNYLTISQFNKTKNLKNKKEKLKYFLNLNKKNIKNINKISLNHGLIGVLVDN